MYFESFTEKDTFNIALNIANKSSIGQIYCLNGDLGVGKTIFAKGFAKGLSIDDDITSPTFTILNEYTSSKIPLYHFDVYRINHFSEMEETGYEDYFYGNGICLIEWSSLIKEILPSNTINITIEKDLSINEYFRKITINLNI